MSRSQSDERRVAFQGRTTEPAGRMLPGDGAIVEFPINVDEDPLAGFDSEGNAEGNESAQAWGSPHFPVEPVSSVDGRLLGLDEVLERARALWWVEAVAILEATCAVLMAGHDEAQAALGELSDIAITAQGTVVLHQCERKGPPGPRLARILLALTASDTVPVPLRLFITRWASFEEAHSVADYAQELAHFSRPNGQVLIRAVYDRCLAGLPSRQTPEIVVSASRPKKETLPRRARHVAFVVGAASVSALLATAVWVWSGSAPWQQQTPLTSRQIAPGGLIVAPSVRPDLSVELRLVRARGNEAGPVSSRKGPVSPAVVAAAVPRAPAIAPLEEDLVRPLPDLRRLTLLPPVPAARVDDDAVKPPGIVTRERSAVRLPSTPAARNSLSDTDDGSPIYSNADLDVQPPVIIDSSLPAPLLSGVNEVNTMELVISERGTVERVRLVSQPRRMADMMLLSGAKTWKFEPASREGRAVRYRLRMSWAATP